MNTWASDPTNSRPGTLSTSLVNHHIYALKTFIKYQEENGNISKNPFSALNFPKPKYPPRRVLSREEIKALYEACQTMRERALLALFYGCGLRRSEAEKLNIDDVNFKNQLLYVRIGKRQKKAGSSHDRAGKKRTWKITIKMSG
jgi:integrase/recombinase XerD